MSNRIKTKRMANTAEYVKTMAGVMSFLEEASPGLSRDFMLTGSGAASCFTLLPGGERGLSHALSLDLDLETITAHKLIGETVDQIEQYAEAKGVFLRNTAYDSEFGMLRCELHFPANENKERLIVNLDIASSYDTIPEKAMERRHDNGFKTPVVTFDHYLEKKIDCIVNRTQVKDHFHMFCVGKKVADSQKRITRGYSQIGYRSSKEITRAFNQLRKDWASESNSITGLKGLQSSTYAPEFPAFLDRMETHCHRLVLLKHPSQKEKNVGSIP